MANRESQIANRSKPKPKPKALVFYYALLVKRIDESKEDSSMRSESRQAAACKMSQNLGTLKFLGWQKNVSAKRGCGLQATHTHAVVWSMKRMSGQLTDWLTDSPTDHHPYPLLFTTLPSGTHVEYARSWTRWRWLDANQFGYFKCELYLKMTSEREREREHWLS